MADRYLLEESAVDGYQLEDASGVVLLEAVEAAAAQTFLFAPVRLDGIGHGGIFPGNRVE